MKPGRHNLQTSVGQMIGRLSLFVIASMLLTTTVVAQDRKFTAADYEFFENKIRPILVDHCLECHGADKNKIRGGLWLTSRKEMLQGGDSGPAVVSGKPDESLLISAVEYDDYEMPPDGQLSDEKIELLKKWIAKGAPDPRKTAALAKPKTIDLSKGREFWAFQPTVKNRPAQVENRKWPRSEIDRYILAKLEAKGLRPANDAERTVLIRRAYLTLIGLPPTIKQIDAFLADPLPTPKAFEKIVDQLLESRHFGERWGRHWLDVVRFAESSGGGRSLMFKDAWRFRDYVIDAYNEDRPFDQMVREQIAGDLLPYQSHEQRSQQLVATGLLALGPTNYEQQDKVLLQMEVIDEQIDTVGRAFMGLTLGCARCHDHKFDPIPTSDYYALVGIFKSTQSLVHGNVSSYVEQSIATTEEQQKLQAYRAEVNKLTSALAQSKKELAKLGGNPTPSKTGKTIVLATSLEGIVVDDEQAKRTGAWTRSVSVPAYVNKGYLHDSNTNKGKSSVVFEPKFKRGGIYEVRLAYSSGGNRASNVPVVVDHQDGKKTIVVNQSRKPPIKGLWISLGKFRFEADNSASVTVTTENTDGHVIVDSVQFLLVETEKKPSKKLDKSGNVGSTNPVSTNKVADPDRSSKPERNKPHSPKTEKQKRIDTLRQQARKLDAQLIELKKNAPNPLQVAMSVREQKKIVDSPVHIRGAVRNHGPLVERGFVTVCSPPGTRHALPEKQSGRLELARWIANPDHPLTARVYVNRVWRHLFGKGIVASTDNFGEMGDRPSHPELLDYLAREFVENGWSTKKLIRKIMLSHVYQLQVQADAESIKLDPENRLLGRANRRRLDVEVLRDSILSASGSLDLTPGGRTIRKITQYDLGYEFKTNRRSVYVPAFRNSMLDFFEVFDFANPNLVVGHRNTSTLPTQSLFLLNNPRVIKNAEMAAQKLLKETEGQTDRQRIIVAYRQVIGRHPTESECLTLCQFVKIDHSENGHDKRVDRFAAVYHVLFCSLDFRYMN